MVLLKGGLNMPKHLLFMFYAVVAYVIFLATFLYAIGFVGGFLAPTQLDAPSRDPLPLAICIDVGLLALFALQHSIMARRWFKQRWTQLVPWTIERSTYVLCASLALLLLFWQWRPIGIVIWSIDGASARLAIWSLCAAGWATVLAMTFYINHFDLFGLRQAWLPLIGRPYAPVSFRTPFPYRVVRHPLYLGFLIAFWSTPHMTLAHLLFAVSTTAYIVLAIQFEERDLLREHGSHYQSYRRSVPMLIPRPFRRSAAQDSPLPNP
jgi:protein-S-isoprenylcysteine O-methyltransferase Ste14